MNKPTNVRLATPENEAALFDFLVALHRENRSGWHHPYNSELVRAKIEAGTRPDPATRTNPNNQERGLIGIIQDDDGKIIASTGLFIGSFYWFSAHPDLIETWIYVRPEARRQTQHLRDLYAFSRWAHEYLKNNMQNYGVAFDLLTGFVNFGDKVPMLDRVWRKLSGATRVGSLYARR